jgi:hypothetical protein
MRPSLAVFHGASGWDFLSASQDSWGIVEIVRPRIHLFWQPVVLLARANATEPKQFLERVLSRGYSGHRREVIEPVATRADAMAWGRSVLELWWGSLLVMDALSQPWASSD